MKFRRNLLIGLVVVLGCALTSFAQSSDLDKVLAAMDRASESFKNATADFDSDQYTKAADDHSHQKGTIYLRREGKNGIAMASNIQNEVTEKVNGKAVTKFVPSQSVIFKNGVVQIYNLGIDQLTEYNAGKSKAGFESFLVLGFGGSGKDLKNQFDMKYAGGESVMGVNTAKLMLTPESEKVRNLFSQIILWIDPARGISVQQEFLSSDGDYRLAKYRNIVLNGKVSDDVFKLKTTGKTQR